MPDPAARLPGVAAQQIAKAKDRRATALEFEQEMISMLTDVKRPDSLASTLAEVSRVGGNVRERLSADMMFLIGQLRDSIQIEHEHTVSRVSRDADRLPGTAFGIFRDGARKHQPRIGLVVHEHRPAPGARDLSDEATARDHHAAR